MQNVNISLQNMHICPERFIGCFANLPKSLKNIQKSVFKMLLQAALNMLESIDGTPAFGYTALENDEKDMYIISHPDFPDHIQVESEP